MRCSQYMKFKNFTFYIQYLQYIYDFVLVSFVLLCINIAKLCQIVPIWHNLLRCQKSETSSLCNPWSTPLLFPCFFFFAVGYHQFKRSHLTSQLIFQHSTRGTVLWKAFSKAKSPFYWKPFVLWNVFTKPATVSPVCYESCILIDGHKWEN